MRRNRSIAESSATSYDPPVSTRNAAIYEEEKGTSPAYDPDVTPAKWKKFWDARKKKK